MAAALITAAQMMKRYLAAHDHHHSAPWFGMLPWQFSKSKMPTFAADKVPWVVTVQGNTVKGSGRRKANGTGEQPYAHQLYSRSCILQAELWKKNNSDRPRPNKITLLQYMPRTYEPMLGCLCVTSTAGLAVSSNAGPRARYWFSDEIVGE